MAQQNNRSERWFSRLNKKLLLGLVIGLLLGWVLSNTLRSESDLQHERDLYPYLSNRLFAVERDEFIINFTQLRQVMRDEQAKIKHPFGVYFEYLPTGVSVGVNDQFEAKIASLSKVPAVMAVYREIEAGNIELDDTITLQQSDLDDMFGTLWQRGAGAELTVEEAIRLTLQQSDNTAANALVAQLPENALVDVFNQLDLPRPQNTPFPDMSPKSYSSVLRSLFLASFVNKEHSNQILELLTDTDYVDKLPAGVPADTQVAHKIGVFRSTDAGEVYSDCGIVYVPDRPYILCMMSASDEAAAANQMKRFSSMVYSYVSQVETSEQD